MIDRTSNGTWTRRILESGHVGHDSWRTTYTESRLNDPNIHTIRCELADGTAAEMPRLAVLGLLGTAPLKNGQRGPVNLNPVAQTLWGRGIPMVVIPAGMPAPTNAPHPPMRDTRMAFVQHRELQDWFRAQVARNFGGACAITGIRDSNIVDALHIWRRADAADDIRDDVRNGLWAVRHLHPLFDAGFWSIGEDMCVIVASAKYMPDIAMILDSIRGRKLPQPLWPLLQRSLNWHGTNVFRGSTRMEK